MGFTKDLDDLRSFGDQRRPLLDQAISSFGPRVERVTWYSEHFSAEIICVAGGDERARARGGLDDYNTINEPGDDPISPWKVLVSRLQPGRPLGDETSLGSDACLQFGVLRRIDPIYAPRQNGDCAAFQGRVVRCPVDAARQARNNDESLVRELAGKEPGQLHARRRALP